MKMILILLTVSLFLYQGIIKGQPLCCGDLLVVKHEAGNVAPVAKTLTFGTVPNIPVETSRCWITSNPGANHQATSVDDTTEASAGWFWQFYLMQGYKHDGII